MRRTEILEAHAARIPYRCLYCGAPTGFVVCHAHTDLFQVDQPQERGQAVSALKRARTWP